MGHGSHLMDALVERGHVVRVLDELSSARLWFATQPAHHRINASLIRSEERQRVSRALFSPR